MTRHEQVGLGLVLGTYLALACAYAWFTPPWNNPDEPAHFNYIVHLVRERALPVLQAGDWDVALLQEAIPERFHPRFDTSPIRYEGHQPPLYYLLGAPAYVLTSGASLRVQVLVLRGTSILLGVLLGLLVYRLSRELVPSRPSSALLATGIALLIPMVTTSAASINNDMLSMTLATAALLALVRYWGEPSVRHGLLLGGLAGLLLLTKLTVYGIAVAAVGVGLARSVLRLKDKPRTHLGLAGLLICPVLVSGWWFLRNGLTYGWGDVLAQRRHDAVVVGQAQYAHLGIENWIYFGTTLFHSFFAQFGWMTIVVDDLTYGLYGAFALLGLVFAAPALWSAGSLPRVLLLGAVAIVIGQLLYYNLSFIQAQGRYLFPAIAPIVLLLALGWGRLTAPGSWVGLALASLWAGVALATAVGGVGDWGLGPLTLTLFVVLSGGIAWLIRPGRERGGSGPGAGEWRRAGALLLGLAALNLMCLLRYVIPFYHG